MLFKRILSFIGVLVLGCAVAESALVEKPEIDLQTTSYMPSVITGTVLGSTGYYVSSVTSCATAVNNLQGSYDSMMSAVGGINMMLVFSSQSKVINLFQQVSTYMTAASSAVTGCGFSQTSSLMANAASRFASKAVNLQSTNTVTMSMYYLVMDINSASHYGTNYYSAGMTLGQMISSM